MAKASSYQYFDLAKPTLPYISYTSPVNEAPHFIQGAQNILCSQIGYAEKRPGFATALEQVKTVLPGTPGRIFTWRRWGGSFFAMVCTIDIVAKVYKLELGSDPSFVLIWTSTSATPFDFVVSDNFCFFGNASDMRKYDGTRVTKWGTDAPPAAPNVALESGSLPPGMIFTGNTLSGTPTTASKTRITFTATDSVGASVSKTFTFEVDPPVLQITTPSILNFTGVGSATTFTFTAQYGTPSYTWSLFSGTLPAGMSLVGNTVTGVPTTAGPYAFALEVTDFLGATAVQSFSTFVQSSGGPSLSPGSPLPSGAVGTSYGPVTITASGGTGPYTFTYIANSGLTNPYNTLPQGMTFTTSGTTVVIGGSPILGGSYVFNVVVTDSTGSVSVKPYSITITPTSPSFVTSSLPNGVIGVPYSQSLVVIGGTGPYTFSYVAGTLDAQTGYVYGYSYTTIYGHESNVSPLSANTGLFTGEDPTLLLIASNDPQVNGINVYRTTDGGTPDPAIMRLVVSLPNTNQTYQDSTVDTDLGTQTGPGFLINTPPTPCLGFVWSNGRIYGFINNKSYYSGAEEVSNGIQEECWPSGADGNFYAWPSEVGGAAVTQNGVDVGMSEQFWQVSGDTLDTFRKSLLLDKAGVGSPTCISSVGNSVQWVDSSKQIWSSSMGEIGEPIRLDLNTVVPSSTFIGYHKSGTFNWIYVLDALAGRLYTYDLDLDQWNTPWTVPATAITSGEISKGVIALLAAINGSIMVFTPGAFVDNGIAYQDEWKMGLIPISPGRNTTARSKIEPTQVEEILFEMDVTEFFNAPEPSFVGMIGDSNPITADQSFWYDLTGDGTVPQYIAPKKTLLQKRYILDSTSAPAIRAAFWITFAPSVIGWKIYSFSISWIAF